MHVVFGDTNIRLHGRCEGEEDCLGPYVFGRGENFVKQLPQIDKDHRNLLIALLKATDFTVMNTQFEKASNKKVTRADWGNEGEPYSPERYAEIDMVLANQRGKSMCKNVETDTTTFFPSHLFPVKLRLKYKLAKNHDRTNVNTNEWKGPEKPNDEKKEHQ